MSKTYRPKEGQTECHEGLGTALSPAAPSCLVLSSQGCWLCATLSAPPGVPVSSTLPGRTSAPTLGRPELPFLLRCAAPSPSPGPQVNPHFTPALSDPIAHLPAWTRISDPPHTQEEVSSVLDIGGPNFKCHLTRQPGGRGHPSQKGLHLDAVDSPQDTRTCKDVAPGLSLGRVPPSLGATLAETGGCRSGPGCNRDRVGPMFFLRGSSTRRDSEFKIT